MPKSKDALALLEVLRREDVKSAAGESTAVSPGQPAEPAAPELPAAAGDSPQPLVRTDGDRLRFSVSTLTLAMALFAALVVLAGAFALGRHLGYSSGWQAAADRAAMIADDEFRELREEPPTPGVLQDLGLVTDVVNREQSQQRRAAYAGRDGFIDELNYIWIETCESEADATAAREFLKNQHIESVVIQNGGKWVVVSKDGFDYKLEEEKAACVQLMDRLKDLGRQYLQAGGRYGFGCYAKKKVPGSTW